MSIIAEGYIIAGQSPPYSAPESIYGLKEASAADRVAQALKNGNIIPFARTKKDGDVISEICFGVPADLLDDNAPRSNTGFAWRHFRRNPREAAEAARILARALQIDGLKDGDGDVVGFFIVPNDEEALFTDIEEDHQKAMLRAEREQTAQLRRIADGLEVLISRLER